MSEPAFEGTFLEGKERRYTIINERDVKKYAKQKWVDKMQKAIDNVLIDVEEGRRKDGKAPYNCYLVINVDEPYAPEVIEIMKRHGHWG